ncbi:hypothetical protein AGIG_G10324 [Arapaima gigas]
MLQSRMGQQAEKLGSPFPVWLHTWTGQQRLPWRPQRTRPGMEAQQEALLQPPRAIPVRRLHPTGSQHALREEEGVVSSCGKTPAL